jgi:hypothetical protein
MRILKSKKMMKHVKENKNHVAFKKSVETFKKIIIIKMMKHFRKNKNDE